MAIFSPFAADLGDRMWTACWQGTLFIAAVWLATRVVTRISPSARCWLWWAACLKLVLSLVWIASFSVPILPAPPHQPRPSTVQINFAGIVSSVESYTDVKTSTAPATAHTSIGIMESLAALWLTGMLICIILAFQQTIALRRLLRVSNPLDDGDIATEARQIGALMGLPSQPRLVESSRVSSPMVVNPLRPTVVLPDGFSRSLNHDELRAALAHELAHIRRRDLWYAVVPALAQALFFFLPPVWLACREWATARESACDKEAMDISCSAAAFYGSILLKIVAADSRTVMVPALGATASYHTLKWRLQMIERFKRPAGTGARVLSSVLVAAGLIFTIPWQVSAQSPSNQILKNGGFEAGATDPDEWSKGATVAGVEYIVDRKTAHGGKASLCLKKTANKFFHIAQWSQTTPMVSAARKLKVSAWVKAENAAKATLDVLFSTPGGTRHEWAAYIGAKKPGDPPATHTWKKYEGTVKIPDDANEVTIALQIYGPGTVWFDDVSAELADFPSTEAPQKPDPKPSEPDKIVSLLSNAGFESGDGPDPSGWQQGQQIAGVEYGWDRSTGYKSKSSLTINKTANRYFPIAQWFQALNHNGSAKTLHVSAMVKASRAGKAVIDVQYSPDGSDWQHKWAAYIGAKNAGDPPADHDWQKYEGDIEIPAGMQRIVVGLQMYGPGQVWFDNVVVEWAK